MDRVERYREIVSRLIEDYARHLHTASHIRLKAGAIVN